MQDQKKLQMEMKQRRVAEDIISQKMGEIENMKYSLLSAVAEHEQTRKNLKSVMNERDILGT